MTLYRTIVADPPWRYDTPGSGLLRSSATHRPNSHDSVRAGVAKDAYYQSMTLDELKALQVPAERNAHLYIWTTNSMMVEAHELVRAWGFIPKTILTWGKVHQDNRDQPSMKVGNWFRGATEHVVFGVRGSLRLTGTWPTLFLWPRIGKHSVKPEAFIDMVEQASPGPYLEMFSRRQRLGWDTFGNECFNTAGFEAPQPPASNPARVVLRSAGLFDGIPEIPA